MKNFVEILFNHNNIEPPYIKVSDNRITIITGQSVLRAGIFDSYNLIEDIQPEKNNIGLGTALLDTLLNYARENCYQLIQGWISVHDLDHINRLKHFYGKFGFTITPNRNTEATEQYFLKLRL